MTKNLSQSLNQSQSSEVFQLSSHLRNYHQYTPHNDQHSGNGTRRRQNRRWSRIPGFHEEYQLSTRNLGQGSCGLVLRCLHRRSNLEYAVKMIRKDRVPRNRVLEECDKYFVCRPCRRIINLHEFYEDADQYYLVFDLMEGGNLHTRILTCGGIVEELDASKIAFQIAEALQFMHSKGVAHRDLKPANILCVRDDDMLPIKVADLDLAGCGGILPGILPPGTDGPVLYTPAGTFEYMAPEVVDAWMQNESPEIGAASANMDGYHVIAGSVDNHVNAARLSYGVKCDLWSLGVIIYFMFCGRTPFEAKCDSRNCAQYVDQEMYCVHCRNLIFDRIKRRHLMSSDPEWSSVPPAAKDLIFKLLENDPEKRYGAEDVLKHPWIKQGSLIRRPRLRTSRILRSSGH